MVHHYCFLQWQHQNSRCALQNRKSGLTGGGRQRPGGSPPAAARGCSTSGSAWPPAGPGSGIILAENVHILQFWYLVRDMRTACYCLPLFFISVQAFCWLINPTLQKTLESPARWAISNFLTIRRVSPLLHFFPTLRVSKSSRRSSAVFPCSAGSRVLGRASPTKRPRRAPCLRSRRVRVGAAAFMGDNTLGGRWGMTRKKT